MAHKEEDCCKKEENPLDDVINILRGYEEGTQFGHDPIICCAD